MTDATDTPQVSPSTPVEPKPVEADPKPPIESGSVKVVDADGEEGDDVGLAAPPRATMTARDALEKLRRGEVLQNVRVDHLKIRGEFAQGIHIRNCLLHEPELNGATIAGDLTFSRCKLRHLKAGRRNTISGNLSLAGCQVTGARLYGVEVAGHFRCDNMESRSRFLVQKCKFGSSVRLWEAWLQGWVEFKECTFAGEADFRSLHAEEGFVLSKCEFNGNALFRGATVEKKFDLGGCRFEKLLDLSKAKLHDFVYLETVQQGPDQRFAFTNAVADHILVRTEQLEGRLASECAGDHAQAVLEYGLMKKTFEGMHRFDQEDWAFYRFKVNQRRSAARSWDKPWTKLAEFFDWLVLDHGCGYCTSPGRAVRSALIIILVFGLIYMTGINSFYLDRSKLPFPEEAVDSAGNRTIMALLMSVSVFTSGFQGIKDVAVGWMNVPLMAESLMGTLLWGLFIVAFGRKVIR